MPRSPRSPNCWPLRRTGHARPGSRPSSSSGSSGDWSWHVPGAHAAIAGYQLLTRDVSRYRTHFPTIDIIAPPQDNNQTAG